MSTSLIPFHTMVSMLILVLDRNDLLSLLSIRRDLYLASSSLDLRRVRKRRRILKNNERLSHATKTTPDSPPEDVQDQGFTRPSVLILLLFRSSALDWFTAMTSHTPSPTYQIENQSRFLTEYGLPAGAVDKLTTAEPGTYPRDHVALTPNMKVQITTRVTLIRGGADHKLKMAMHAQL
ncbi:hypothetical protein M378DRAFT_197478 [Amanita muscaria Koide BX008]|uniref:UTP25 NTP hydrolase-like domain-containing protein n=1 Tax=Amanita muscaria (strain Koide BX008) TaxID=946122 RepID=A0A0C2SSQ5_AMAMK|nr:hypothetical protein M378DRAFT_197478 [Amanita muscaria Koide BX008]